MPVSPHGPTPTPRRIGIPELLAGPEPTVSFEFFPPRDDAAEAQLWRAIRRLEKVSPSFVSVTYGAGGSTRDRTVRITGRIARETTVTAMAHLTCVGSSVGELRQVIGHYAAAGIRNVLALRGDPPGGPGMPWTPHPDGLDHADQLVSLVRALGDFTVGVAAFPDKHPESPSLEHDAQVLVRKAEAGASFAVSQFVFDPQSWLRLRDAVRARGCDLPILPGVMPVTNVAQVARMAQLSGTPLPRAVVDRLEAVAGDPAAVRAVGVEIATEICERLLREGAPGLHFYTMNRSTASLRVYRNLGLTPARRHLIDSPVWAVRDDPRADAVHGPVTVRAAGRGDNVHGRLVRLWHGDTMVVHGRVYSVDEVEVLVAVDRTGIVGFLTYAMDDRGRLEIVSADAAMRSRGVGRALVTAAAERARAGGASRLVCTTTNDNVDALAFWQIMGFELTAVRPGAVAAAREVKATIPHTGAHGIPIRDEIDLERAL